MIIRFDKYHTYALEKYRNWEYRQSLIFKELENCKADIICLQETDTENFDVDLSNFMKKIGYNSIQQDSKKKKENVTMVWETVIRIFRFFEFRTMNLNWLNFRKSWSDPHLSPLSANSWWFLGTSVADGIGGSVIWGLQKPDNCMSEVRLLPVLSPHMNYLRPTG